MGLSPIDFHGFPVTFDITSKCIERLALEIMKEYAIWLGMTHVITSQQ